jgi:predicted glycoside hydrolase/deacetylase ChbG (UPF0249 family)
MRSALLLAALAGSFLPFGGLAEPTLAERLGYRASDRLLIVNGDDVGMCHTANLATIEALEQGVMTSSTILVPCPWFLEIANYAKEHPDKDFGVHLCQTSEWRVYRWGPVAPRSEVPRLIDPEGYFWHETPQVYASATPDDAYREAKAQIQKALDAGVDVTHLDSHMGVMQYRPDYLEKYLQLAVDFDLPVRMASQTAFEKGGQANWRPKFAAKGILFTDDFVYDEVHYGKPEEVKPAWMKRLAELKPGVTELFIHAGKPTDELKAITGSWAIRSAEFETFAHDPEIRALLERNGIKRIGYRPVRELQRKLRKQQP